MNIQEAKQLDMVDYLSSLGFQPASIKGNNYWYRSPLGDEKTPSFKINRALNKWYDFRDGIGGNLIDFGVAYFKCPVSDFLARLGSPTTSVHKQRTTQNLQPSEDRRKIEVLSVHPISSFPLMRYLKARRIPHEIADKYLREVRYKTGDKNFYAIGFKNDSGGYELRNEKFKGSSSPKDITTVDNGSRNLAVFEGFFNFLSYQTMLRNQEQPHRNFLILNSTSFFEKSMPLMNNFQSVHLYLDNDKTGEKWTRHALESDPVKYKDERALYKSHADLNDWLIHFGQVQKQPFRQRL